MPERGPDSALERIPRLRIRLRVSMPEIAPNAVAVLRAAEALLAIRRRNRRDEPVSPAVQRLDKSRIVGLIAQRLPQFLDGAVQAQIEVDESVRGPEPGLQFFAGHDLARTLQKYSEHLKGLLVQFDLHPGLAQFTGLQINFEESETALYSDLLRGVPSSHPARCS